MAVTIKEVAKLANVSPSTVSRVLSDSNMISEETKQIVRKAVKELNYHPHAIARSLANKETKTIGLILHSSADEAFLNSFFPEIIRGISRVLTAKGYYMLLSTSKNDAVGNEELINLSFERRIDGLILLTSWADDGVVRELRKDEFPTVVIGRPSSDILVDWVDNDNQKSAYNATMHLADNGYSKIAYLGGSYKLMATAERIEGYVKALIDRGLDPNENYFKETDISEKQAYDATNELLDMEEAPDAIICNDEIMAFGAIKAIRDRNLTIPNDIGILVFNDTMSISFTFPAITSVDLNVIEVGRNAANMLIDRIKNPLSSPKSLIIPSKLIIRESTIRGE